MRYALPRYEVKYNGKDEWEEISDIDLMERLYRIYDRVTPAIKEMIKGNKLQTADAVYRLKWKGGDSEISDHQQSWGYEEGPGKGPGSAGDR